MRTVIHLGPEVGNVGVGVSGVPVPLPSPARDNLSEIGFGYNSVSFVEESVVAGHILVAMAEVLSTGSGLEVATGASLRIC